MFMKSLLEKALIPYSFWIKSLKIESELSSWSNDLHYKIVVDGKTYSARFLKENRSPNNVFGDISEEVLTEQTKFCRYLIEHGIPFMRFVPALNGDPYTRVKWEDEYYRFILFDWLEGEHITQCDENIAWKFGKMARQFHDISSAFESEVFAKKSHLIGYKQFVDQLRNKIKSSVLDKTLLLDYLELAEKYIRIARSEKMDYMIQTDLNPQNVLWDENKNIIGIVDFESIGYNDRIEGLAWLIKWYSRTEGINSSNMSPEAAKALLNGYRAFEFIEQYDYDRLTSLLWLSGCMNWNFVKETNSILESSTHEKLVDHLSAYKIRGEKLISLVPKAFLSI